MSCMTTVGYGDKTPITVQGRIVACLTSIASVVAMALPTWQGDAFTRTTLMYHSRTHNTHTHTQAQHARTRTTRAHAHTRTHVFETLLDSPRLFQRRPPLTPPTTNCVDGREND